MKSINKSIKLTDLKIANFVGVTNKSLQNWKKPITEINGTKFYPPTGRHNLYIGARLSTYLLSSNDEELNNNLDNLVLSVNKLEDLINLVEKECKNSKYIKDLKEEISYINEKIKEIEQLTFLS